MAGDIHISHCLKACPTGTNDSNDLVVNSIFALSNNKETKFADWVAYRVTKSTIATTKDLNRGWQPDPQLEDNETLEPKDYKGASAALNIDRGHQAPLAAFAGTVFWRDTNVLSNITPQKKDLNQGPWQRLEGRVRDAAYKNGEVYVITGPLFEGNMQPLPQADEGHNIPSGYWKVIVSKKSSKGVGFIMGQDTARNRDECSLAATISEIESRSGLSLFPSVSITDGTKSLVGC